MAFYSTTPIIYVRKFFQDDHQPFLLSIQPVKSIAVGMIIETNSWNTAFIYSTNFDLHFQCGPGILLGIGVQGSKQRCDLELQGINIAIEG